MLIPQERLLPFLICPVTGNPLKKKSGGDMPAEYCDSSDTYTYQKTGGKPVLVNFETSLLDVEQLLVSEGQSLVPRQNEGGVLAKLKTTVNRPSKATTANVATLLHQCNGCESSARVLLIGGGTVGYGMSPFFSREDIDLVSFDIYASPTVQLIADAHDLPFKSGTFDIVIIQAVLEHVLEPTRVVAEIHRVLSDDGIVYAETPFMQQVHEGAYDFTRFSERGHRYLFRYFDQLYSGPTAGPGTAMIWSIEHLFRGLFRSRLIGKLARLFFFWLQYLDDIVGKDFSEDAASAVYFMGKKSNQATSPKETIAGYTGAQ